MIWQIIKKQGLILLRNPRQLLLLVGLPIILIAILGTALAGMMDDDTTPAIHVKVGILEHEDEEAQTDRFLEKLEDKGLPEEAMEEIQANREQMTPIQMLKKSVFGSGELKEMVELREVKSAEKEAVMSDDSYDALLEVPENFTYDALAFMFLDEPSQPMLHLFQNEGSDIGFSVVKDVVQQFQEQLTLNTFIGKEGIDPSVIKIDKDAFAGETIPFNQQEPVSAQGYYAIGMVVMNVLFIASTIGSMAFLEKKMYVFDRIILANVSRWIYFAGILISTSLFAFLQLMLIYGFSWLVYGVQWPHLLPFIAVSLAYAIAVGSIGVLLTALSFRINTEAILSLFSIIIVSLLAFIGGSFYPVGDSSAFLQRLGDLTPNGAAMSAYLAVLRGDGISAISHHLYFLVIFAFVAILIAAMSFPKRGLTT